MNTGINVTIYRVSTIICVYVRSIYLFAAKNAEPFYQKLCFVGRPPDIPGMKYEPSKS